jgi:FAD dependent oxidoreductase
MVRVAVIGGGVFGATTAVDLARAGASVDLFEARDDILHGATARCQARLHRGYHYPRSDATAAAARDAAPEFEARYPAAIRTAAHHYVIAEDSKVSAGQYLAFLGRLNLPYEVVEPPQVHHAQLTVRVPESFVDVDVLRRLLRGDLILSGVQMHLGRRVGPDDLPGYDLIVAATYGQPWSRPLRYELCEVALVEVARYEGQSFVVLDGDHVSLDPYGRVHMLYDVVNSVHMTGESHDMPSVGGYYHELLSAWGPRKTSRINVKAMLANAGRHLRGMDPNGQGVAIYHGSLFSVRAVLPDVDATDERPTLVERDGNVVSILSGKICTAVATARQVTATAMGLVPA